CERIILLLNDETDSGTSILLARQLPSLIHGENSVGAAVVKHESSKWRSGGLRSTVRFCEDTNGQLMVPTILVNADHSIRLRIQPSVLRSNRTRVM
ncbi:hypothetical protein, partial [Gemmatimonas sp.]|uniref:hypothetical protein n=1 Tax=Gemmatimonas sp. TaxID=1962908 RepID=UPI0039830281